MRRDPFQAISDPTRRAILGILSREALNLNSLAARFDISRPAISRQVRILTECGLVTVRKEGRERYCQASLQPLGDVAHWLEPYRIFWTAKLDALDALLSKNPSGGKRARTKAASPKLKSKKSK